MHELSARSVFTSCLKPTFLSQTLLALNPKNSRALTVPFNGAGRILKVTTAINLLLTDCNGYFKKNTALSKSQATDAVKARIRVCKFFWRALRDLTCTLPRSLSAGKVADKRTPNEEYFRLRKFVSREVSDCILSALCLLRTFWRKKCEIEINAYKSATKD